MSKPIRSELMRGVLVEARSLWAKGDSNAATERAARVFLVEGREVFGLRDRELFEAMLARLHPPQGFTSWDAWFEYDAAHPTREDTRTDEEVIEEIQRKRGKTTLHDAIEAGALARANALIDSGADVNAVFQNGDLRWTPLCAAVFGDHLALIDKLLAAGARVHGAGLTSAIMGVRSVAVAERLAKHGARFDEVDDVGRTVLARVADVGGDVASPNGSLRARRLQPRNSGRSINESFVRAAGHRQHRRCAV